jgi:hypothetical protein
LLLLAESTFIFLSGESFTGKGTNGLIWYLTGDAGSGAGFSSEPKRLKLPPLVGRRKVGGGCMFSLPLTTTPSGRAAAAAATLAALDIEVEDATRLWSSAGEDLPFVFAPGSSGVLEPL